MLLKLTRLSFNHRKDEKICDWIIIYLKPIFQAIYTQQIMKIQHSMTPFSQRQIQETDRSLCSFHSVHYHWE